LEKRVKKCPKVRTPHTETPIAEKRGKTFGSLFAVLAQQFVKQFFP
jgi:hypothetical protein